MVIWRRIEEFKDYLISSNGKCFSLKTNKLLKPQQYPNGYWFYSFKVDGIQHTRLINRLVAKTFITIPMSNLRFVLMVWYKSLSY